jgi:thiol-disulfide isomerase/thioredoxin
MVTGSAAPPPVANAHGIIPSFSLLGAQRCVCALVFALCANLLSAADGGREKGAAPLEIAYGAKVKLADYLVPGKTTVFDFYSTYCPTCMGLKPGIERLHAERTDIAIVFVNINRPGFKGIDWDSPVSRQYKLPSTPQFKVYGPDGRLQAEGKPAYQLVTSWLH